MTSFHQRLRNVPYHQTKWSGLFVKAKINEHEVDCLIDTGASLTLVSMCVYELLRQNYSSLKKFDKEIVSATGDELDIKGVTEETIQINISISGCSS